MYCQQRPRAKRHAHQVQRKHVMVWVDAAGASRHTAMVASYDAKVVYFHCKSPDKWWNILNERGDNPIGNQDMFSIVLAIGSRGDVINGAVVTLSCDNASVLHSMFKGASNFVKTNQMIGRTWFEVMQKRIGLHLLRVQSEANIADLPSRMDFQDGFQVAGIHGR